MGGFIDLTGRTFGRLTVVSRVQGSKRTRWDCLCECGKAHGVDAAHLTGGAIKSCGCLRDDTTRSARTIHNGKGTILYSKWKGMRRRCSNLEPQDAQYYKDRGISVCSEWDDFGAFRLWAMANGYKDGLSIDRIDNDKGYSPDNCRWVDTFTQSINQRIRCTNTTGYIGVNPGNRGFTCRVTYMGDVRYLGTYGTAIEAAIARDDFIKANGWPNPLNFKEAV